MEKLEAEIQSLRKQVRTQSRVVGILVFVVVLFVVAPLFRSKQARQNVVSTDVLTANQVRLTGEDGNTAVLTSDSLTFSATPSSVAASIGVDENRQPSIMLSYYPTDTLTGVGDATMLIHRNSEGVPSAAFMDRDAHKISWYGE